MFYNFRRKDGITRTCGMQLNKFVLLESMKGLYKRISCNEYTHRYSSAIFEITFDYYTNRTIDPLTFGWVIAYKNYENVMSQNYQKQNIKDDTPDPLLKTKPSNIGLGYYTNKNENYFAIQYRPLFIDLFDIQNNDCWDAKDLATARIDTWPADA